MEQHAEKCPGFVSSRVEPIDCTCDGYHTFDELYEHRHALFIALCHKLKPGRCWKSRLHDDGTIFYGMFIAGIDLGGGKQITYHLPNKLYKQLKVPSRRTAPRFDGHTSDDVLERLKEL